MLTLFVSAAEDFTKHYNFDTAFIATGWWSAAILVFGVILAIVHKDILSFVLALIPLILGCILIFGFYGVIVGKVVSKAQIQEFQGWAADTYLLDLEYDEAQSILGYQGDITGDDTPEDKLEYQRFHPTKTIYGQKVEAGLMKNGDEWEMIIMGDIAVRVPDKTDTAKVK